jgi:hypothetical protein
MFKISLISAITLAASSVFGATLQGSANITPQDYIGLRKVLVQLKFLKCILIPFYSRISSCKQPICM